jgi:phosphoglycerol transferase MdoB-like AlkP superfamily enzyme
MQQAILLFTLNFFDAGMTLLWTETGRATEANHLMQYFLDGGPAVFLIFKICIGMLAALCFYRWSHLPSARVGLKLSLAVYFVIFAIHIGVGLVSSGVTGWLGL